MSGPEKRYARDLIFMLLACGGAFVWQFCLPWMGGRFTSWGDAPGWQREIALWNVGLMVCILIALLRRDRRLMRLMTIQSAVLCWALGANHLISLAGDLSLSYGIHILGVLEVMLLGGIWGTVLLVRTREKEESHGTGNV